MPEATERAVGKPDFSGNPAALAARLTSWAAGHNKIPPGTDLQNDNTARIKCMSEVQSLSPSNQAAAAKPVRDVPSMLLPVQDKLLLLPGVAVAEIVNYSYPDCPPDAPDWFSWLYRMAQIVCAAFIF
jgi:hypothetical protein